MALGEMTVFAFSSVISECPYYRHAINNHCSKLNRCAFAASRQYN